MNSVPKATETPIEKRGLPAAWLNYATYRDIRLEKGTQAAVAALLGVTVNTLSRRETRKVRVTREHFLALLALPDRPAADGAQTLLPLTIEGGAS